MSRIFLKDNVTLCRADGSSVKFHIKAHIGSGASCVVYHAVCDDNTEHLLKEYYPRNLDLERADDCVLIVPEHKREVFDKGLQRFRNGNERLKAVRLSENLKNFTSNVQGYFYGNGTEYIDMTVFAGRTYSKVENETLHDLMLRMKTLAQVIGYYHDEGLLHLDIKPDNIFVRPENETVEDVMLFDFDSVIEKSNKIIVPALSYTKDWAAPEQLLPYKRNSICEATDLFSIGEIIFTKIFGRHSTQAERRSFADYDIDRDAKIFENVNPKVVPLIQELFRHTLCAVPQRRYHTTDELIAKLNEIIKLLASDTPFLESNWSSKKNINFQSNPITEKMLSGMQNGGRYFLKNTEKRDLSKYIDWYIDYAQGQYDIIVYLDAGYAGLIEMIKQVPLKNFKLRDDSGVKTDYHQIFDALDAIIDERTLFVIGNFHEGCLVDDRYFDIDDIKNLCLRLRTLKAHVLVNGSFDLRNFRNTTRFYRYYHELLYALAEQCLEKQHFYAAEEYINNAKKIATQCDSYKYEFLFKDNKLAEAIKAEAEWSAGYGFDEDELRLDEFLEQFQDCLD